MQKLSLTIFGSDKVELHLGDLVKIGGNHGHAFYTRIKLLPDGRLYPFSCFSYRTIIKIDALPDNATYSQKDACGNEYWYGGDADMMPDQGMTEWLSDAKALAEGQFTTVFYKIRAEDGPTE